MPARENRSINPRTVVRDMKAVLEKRDSRKVSLQLYRFLTVYGPFIAHYDIYGFREVYADLRPLVRSIIRDGWGSIREFIENRHSYMYDTKLCGEYVGDVWRDVLALCERYRESIELHFARVETEQAKNHLQELAHKLGYDIVPARE